MNKAIAYEREGKKIGITSAVATSMKGYIYVEAFSEGDVQTAVSGMSLVTTRNPILVPAPDLPAVLTVATSTKDPIKTNQWARVTRGLYKDDLVRIADVKDDGAVAVVEIIPRLDYGLIREGRRSGAIMTFKGPRPPQKFFNVSDIEEMNVGGSRLSKDKNWGWADVFDVFEGNYYLNGFLYKEMNPKTHLRMDNVDPTLEEISRSDHYCVCM